MINATKFDAGQAAKGLFHSTLLGAVNHQRTPTQGVPMIAHLTLGTTNLFGFGGLSTAAKAPPTCKTVLAVRFMAVDSFKAFSNTSGKSGTINQTTTVHDERRHGRRRQC
ncbi:hypothetical protein ACA910_006309 [Epithemia clementina (nom. ined.)]